MSTPAEDADTLRGQLMAAADESMSRTMPDSATASAARVNALAYALWVMTAVAADQTTWTAPPRPEGDLR